MALFKAQAKEVDIIITTALIRESDFPSRNERVMANNTAGRPAPKLLLKEAVDVMKRELLVSG